LVERKDVASNHHPKKATKEGNDGRKRREAVFSGVVSFPGDAEKRDFGGCACDGVGGGGGGGGGGNDDDDDDADDVF